MNRDEFGERVKQVGLVGAVFDLVTALTEVSKTVVTLGGTVLEVGKTVASVVPAVAQVEKAATLAKTEAEAVKARVDALTQAGGKVGFLGKAPVVQQKVTVAPLGTKAATVKVANISVLAGATSAVIDNNVERLNQIEAALKAYGLLP